MVPFSSPLFEVDRHWERVFFLAAFPARGEAGNLSFFFLERWSEKKNGSFSPPFPASGTKMRMINSLSFFSLQPLGALQG